MIHINYSAQYLYRTSTQLRASSSFVVVVVVLLGPRWSGNNKRITDVPLWRTVWRFLKKLKIQFPYDSAVPLLGIYLEKTVI